MIAQRHGVTLTRTRGLTRNGLETSNIQLIEKLTEIRSIDLIIDTPINNPLIEHIDCRRILHHLERFPVRPTLHTSAPPCQAGEALAAARASGFAVAGWAATPRRRSIVISTTRSGSPASDCLIFPFNCASVFASSSHLAQYSTAATLLPLGSPSFAFSCTVLASPGVES